MSLSPAEPAHLDEIKRLLSTCGLPYDDLTPAHLEHFLVDLDRNDALRGVIGVELFDTVALLRSLAVAAEHRGQGIGARLTDGIVTYARRNGAEDLYLFTTTASGYFRARGFTKVNRNVLPDAIQNTEEATRLCPSSATCMRKRLDAPAHINE